MTGNVEHAPLDATVEFFFLYFFGVSLKMLVCMCVCVPRYLVRCGSTLWCMKSMIMRVMSPRELVTEISLLLSPLSKFQAWFIQVLLVAYVNHRRLE